MLLHESDCLFPTATPLQMYRSPTDTKKIVTAREPSLEKCCLQTCAADEIEYFIYLSANEVLLILY